LISRGHIHAGRYPLAKLWSEKEIMTRRVNQEIANEAALTKAATAASFHGGKAHGVFKGIIEKLTGK
jgi:hypothetical protein